MKKLIIILALISMIGCATQKEAVNKGYVVFDKKEAIVGSIWCFLSRGEIGCTDGWEWNIELMKLNYPECYVNGTLLHESRICVWDKAKEEGRWK